MVRSELVLKLSKAYPDLQPETVELLVSTFFDGISDRLADDGRVELRGFGVFSTRPRAARTARNPRTGGAVHLEAKRVPYFKPAKDLAARLKG